VAHGNWHKKFLSQADLKEISFAVKKAEANTNVEIIPVLEKSAAAGLSDIYYLKFLKAVLAFIPSVSFTFFLSSVLFRLYNIWWNPLYFHILCMLALYSFFYYLFWYFPYPILPKGLYQVFAFAKVKSDFAATKSYQTKKKESFLIYGFLREHQIILYGDKKIFNRLDDEIIQPILDVYALSAKNKDLKTAYVEAIELAGEALAKEFPKTADDLDEIDNEMTIKE